MLKAGIVKTFRYFGLGVSRIQPWRPTERQKEFTELFEGFQGLTLSHAHYTTYKATEYIVKNDIEGDLIECGVLWGQQIMIMATTLLKLGDTNRNIYLYDTFEGMTEPGKEDFSELRGQSYKEVLGKWKYFQRDGFNIWGYAPVDTVREYLKSTGYPMERFHFVKGDVRETLPNDFHNKIALLRLDTDWYELTKHELDHLYGSLSRCGILICDDYITWIGARKAVDEFFADLDTNSFIVDLFSIGGGEKIFLKTDLKGV